MDQRLCDHKAEASLMCGLEVQLYEYSFQQPHQSAQESCVTCVHQGSGLVAFLPQWLLAIPCLVQPLSDQLHVVSLSALSNVEAIE